MLLVVLVISMIRKMFMCCTGLFKKIGLATLVFYIFLILLLQWVSTPLNFYTISPLVSPLFKLFCSSLTMGKRAIEESVADVSMNDTIDGPSTDKDEYEHLCTLVSLLVMTAVLIFV